VVKVGIKSQSDKYLRLERVICRNSREALAHFVLQIVLDYFGRLS
jgi:hypothetical protein